jgi:hypothetical protein
MSLLCTQKLARLKIIVAERSIWAEQLKQVKRMRQWVLDTEHLLNGSWAQPGEVVSNETVGRRLDSWRQVLARQLTEGTLSELEQACLSEFVQVLSNLRPYLVQCYDRKEFPRTNNELERSIRGLKTQYRRISGRTNWNTYLLRYGRCVAYAAWWEQDVAHRQQLEQRVARLDRARWRELRQESKATQGELLKRFRFRYRRQQFLDSLEARWAAASPTRPLP